MRKCAEDYEQGFHIIGQHLRHNYLLFSVNLTISKTYDNYWDWSWHCELHLAILNSIPSITQCSTGKYSNLVPPYPQLPQWCHNLLSYCCLPHPRLIGQWWTCLLTGSWLRTTRIRMSLTQSGRLSIVCRTAYCCSSLDRWRVTGARSSPRLWATSTNNSQTSSTWTAPLSLSCCMSGIMATWTFIHYVWRTVHYK